MLCTFSYSVHHKLHCTERESIQMGCDVISIAQLHSISINYYRTSTYLLIICCYLRISCSLIAETEIRYSFLQLSRFLLFHLLKWTLCMGNLKSSNSSYDPQPYLWISILIALILLNFLLDFVSFTTSRMNIS